MLTTDVLATDDGKRQKVGAVAPTFFVSKMLKRNAQAGL